MGDIAQVAAAGFTAVAAGAAWRSVDQGQRLWQHSIEPDPAPALLVCLLAPARLR